MNCKTPASSNPFDLQLNLNPSGMQVEQQQAIPRIIQNYKRNTRVIAVTGSHSPLSTPPPNDEALFTYTSIRTLKPEIKNNNLHNCALLIATPRAAAVRNEPQIHLQDERVPVCSFLCLYRDYRIGRYLV